ncbi:MAG: 2Fe-2S iron-sulfur cluster binding domain-containing protein [Acidobacteria bacterium]|nr:2Fe-2S iron-sulfur cluster binding domain-containing protein [Acidobacteriota bacterium]
MAPAARTRRGELPLVDRGTLMARCLQAGLPVASSCAGRGACGRCALEILEGAEALSRRSRREWEVLSRNGHPEGWRLACRVRIRDEDARILVRAGYW